VTPAAAIAILDRQIAKHGQPVTLRRVVANSAAATADVSAFVRGYRPDELVAGIQQGDTLVTLSPTSVAGTPFSPAVPRRGDKVVIDGRVRNVELADAVSVAGTMVRLNLQVRG
jgi:hypothetical protein